MKTFFSFFFAGLPRRHRQRFWQMTAFIAFSALVELAALGALALFITSLTSLDDILASRSLAYARLLFGDALFRDARSFYFVLGLVTVALVLLKNMLSACQAYFAARFEGVLNTHYGNKMLRAFFEAPYEAAFAWNSAEAMQMIGWRVYVGLFASTMVAILCDIMVSLLLFISLFLLQPLATSAVVLVLGGLGFLSFRVFRNRISTLSHRSGMVLLDIGKIVMFGVQGLRDVKLFGRGGESLARFEGAQINHARLQARQRVYERATVWVMESVGMGGVVLGALWMIRSQDFSSGEMMATLSLIAVSAWRILPAMYRSVGGLGLLRSYATYIERVREFLHAFETMTGEGMQAERRALPPLERRIELRGVSFRYKKAESPALNDVSFSVEAGQLVGIIGHSGAGKSTLADILTGLIEPSDGVVMVDGEPLDARGLDSWCSQIGFVSQQPYLFDGSVAENVAFTVDVEAIDFRQVEECCRSAGILDFLSTLPDGVRTLVGERGSQLSGGQVQRIAIARALYKNSRVLIFDEATSALDDKTERKIRETITTLAGGRTIIVIAHRLRTVADCDMLVWLDQGRLVMHGKPFDILPRYEESDVCLQSAN